MAVEDGGALRATMPPESGGEPVHERAAASGAAAAERDVAWSGGLRSTPVHDFHSLAGGERIAGPALVDAGETTSVVPEGWTATKADGSALRVSAEVARPWHRHQITEYLEIDLETERWHLPRLRSPTSASAREDYKRGLLLHDRDPREVYEAAHRGRVRIAPDPGWCRIVECTAPAARRRSRSSTLPPGHPLMHDIEIDVDALKERQVRLREAMRHVTRRAA